jgi:hypothetical protein
VIGVSQDKASPAVILLMRQTAPWVTLLSILLMIIAPGGLLPLSFEDIVARTSRPSGQPGLLIFVLIPASVYLWRFASGIRRLLKERTQAALEAALLNQKSLWKCLGIGLGSLMALLAASLVRSALR